MRYQFGFSAAVLAGAFSVGSASAQSGATTYQAKCAMCHAADGSGNTPAGKSMAALPLKSAAVMHASDATLIASTTNGKGKMPAYKSQLTAPQIVAVVAYVRTLQK